MPNLALVCDRGSKVSPISNVFVTNMLCDLHVNGSGSYAFLLYRLKSEILTLMPHSSAKKQAITISIAEAEVQPSLYSVLPNLALVCDRGSKVSPISNVFVTNMLCDLHVNGSGSYAFLLYRLK
ncbi:hypothetical protein RGC53_04290 [Helicobacter pylori]|uniref:DNA methyltransferase n=1 Tax=Helicobacter pylori TaxID=210 RepID=A0AAW8XG10_HELPX|nr:hypothetical protein [Helicobacter pylori]MDU9790048.1 hypothetical protein [Helicobacter pylori]